MSPNDPVFSQKMLGDGFAIIPDGKNITAPFAGKVVSVFPTRHAISFRAATGIDYLIHIGIDTVQLKGTPFSIFVSENDTVQSGDLIAEVDFEQIINAKKDPSVIVVFTEENQIKRLSINNGMIEGGHSCGEIYL